MATNSLLELIKVGASYGQVKILQGISFKVESGECVSVLGANGAGKTTLLRAVMGLMVRREGNILLEGSAIDNSPTDAIVSRGVSLAPEGRHLFPPLTVMENLEAGSLPLRTKGRHAEANAAREQVMELFPRLSERLKQVAGTLSGGEQQMLAIGRALMAQPRILLLDEPSVGLAPKVIEVLFEVFHKLKERGLTIVLAEQNVRLALDLADRVALLHLGRLKAIGTAQEMKATDDIRKIYLGG